MEEWRSIPGYEGCYEVSNLGQVKSLKRNGTPERIMKPRNDKDGYLILDIRKQYKRKTVRIHRLVAIAFIDNPNNKSEVNHINFNKADNSISNLEWTTPEENKAHSSKNNIEDVYAKRRYNT